MIEELHSHENKDGEIVIDKVNASSHGKTLARVYGFMGAGLLITALVALILSSIVAFLIQDSRSQIVALYSIMIISIVGVFVSSFTMPTAMRKQRASAILSYFLYASFIGGLCSSLLLTGLDFYTLAISFGITSVIYFSLFLLGYVFKVRLNILSSILVSGLISFCFIGIFWWVLYLLIPGIAIAYNLMMSFLIMAIILVSTVYDASRLKHELDEGYDYRIRNFDVMHASIMYSNFINILLWVIRIVSNVRNR